MCTLASGEPTLFISKQEALLSDAYEIKFSCFHQNLWYHLFTIKKIFPGISWKKNNHTTYKSLPIQAYILVKALETSFQNNQLTFHHHYCCWQTLASLKELQNFSIPYLKCSLRLIYCHVCSCGLWGLIFACFMPEGIVFDSLVNWSDWLSFDERVKIITTKAIDYSCRESTYFCRSSQEFFY